MISKILVAVAGRGLCEEMLKYLMEIPSIQAAKVTVLHVVPPQVSADAMSAKLEEGGKILAEAVKNLNLDPSKVQVRLKQGDPKDIVCQVADEEEADLIIMGSRALGRLQAILENSVSQYVFQLTSRPMLLVKDDIYVRKINRIMVPLGKAEDNPESLQLALFLLREITGGQLILTRVVPKGSKQITADQDPILLAAVKKANQFGVFCRTVIVEGDVGEQICAVAQNEKVDLLMIGSPDRRPSIAKTLIDIDRFMGGSTSDYVRINAPCPVLLARTSAS